MQEQQELAQLFGQVAFKAIGDLGLKEGSPEKAALDIVFGGIMTKVGGGKFAEGAASAGLTQLVMNELKNIKDPALLQWATAIVGAAAAKVVGGKAQTGASVAVSEVKNNWLGHEQYDFANELAKALDGKDEEYMRDVLARYYAQSNYNAQHGLTGEGDDERITESLYPVIDCLVGADEKEWLKGGLNYTLDKIINRDPEMFRLANEYRNQLEQNGAFSGGNYSKKNLDDINWIYSYNDNYKQWRIDPETGVPHPDDLEEYYRDQAEKQSISDNLSSKVSMVIGVPSAENAVFIKTENIFSDFAKQATKNANSVEVVLGKYNENGVSYVNVAKGRGATYFELDSWNSIVAEVGEENIWNINQAFIKQQSRDGKTFILSHNPDQATGYYAKEVDCLKEMGYRFIREGEIWKAKK